VNLASAIALAVALLLQGCAIMPPCYGLARDVSGQVLDARTGRPIAGATIVVREADVSSFRTSTSGMFSTGHRRRFLVSCAARLYYPSCIVSRLPVS